MHPLASHTCSMQRLQVRSRGWVSSAEAAGGQQTPEQEPSMSMLHAQMTGWTSEPPSCPLQGAVCKTPTKTYRVHIADDHWHL